MQANSEQAVLNAATKVFETSAFLSVYAIESEQELEQPDHTATMTFRGAADGRVSIRISSGVLDSIVDNLLEPQDDPDEQVVRRGDVLKEMLNMLCGNLLTEYFGAEPVFYLSPPELLGTVELPAPTSKDVHRVAFSVENTLAEVMFEIQNQLNS